jgi:hypothetical protein
MRVLECPAIVAWTCERNRTRACIFGLARAGYRAQKLLYGQSYKYEVRPDPGCRVSNGRQLNGYAKPPSRLRPAAGALGYNRTLSAVIVVI